MSLTVPAQDDLQPPPAVSTQGRLTTMTLRLRALRVRLRALATLTAPALAALAPAAGAQAAAIRRLAVTSAARSIADTSPPAPTADSGSGGIEGFYDRHPWVPRLVGAQFTYIGQQLFPLHADYSGPHSLTTKGDFEGTHTYGVYVGSRIASWLQAYVDVEMARGAGVSHATGLAGLTDGDVIRQGSVDLSKGPYLARAYLRYFLPLGRGIDTAARGQDQVPGVEPSTRIEVKAGKLALSDDFDLNRYANTTRYQFENWGLWNNSAWDFAADTRGYTNGVVVGYVSPRWMLKVAAVQMPTFANGNLFDDDLAHAYGLNAELTVRPWESGTVMRLLAYDNRGRMGVYRDAIDIAMEDHTIPDIVADDKKGRAKYGFGLNLEQPLADSGNTGVFLRLGWNDGRTEDFVFTEADRHLSAGFQLAGTGWRRADDRFGVALLVHGLSGDHAAYLAADGLGFLLGDGGLNYRTEDIGELYYRFAIPVLTICQVTPDYQLILNPGYNRDRGPAQVAGIRINLHY